MLVLSTEINTPTHLRFFGVDLGTVMVTKIEGNRIKLGFELVPDVKVLRDAAFQRDKCDQGKDGKK